MASETEGLMYNGTTNWEGHFVHYRDSFRVLPRSESVDPLLQTDLPQPSESRTERSTSISEFLGRHFVRIVHECIYV